VSFEDKILTCRDCGTEFIFTAGEQEFYAQKGFANEPTRCRNCRQQRKAQRNESPNERGFGNTYGDRSSASYSDRPNGASYHEREYGGSYRSDTNSGYGQRERVQHETVCSQCGRVTTVPFVPRGDRPVYCRECYAQQRTSRPPNRGYNRY